MKKLFTLLSMLVLAFAVNAQQSFVTSPVKVDKDGLVSAKQQPVKYSASPNKKRVQQSSRNASTSIMIDYAGVDAAYATVLGTDVYYVNFLDINKYYTNTTNLTHRWGVALYDSLLYLDANNNDLPAFLPRKTSTLTLDSFDIFFVHENVTNNADTITIYVAQRDSFRLTGTGPNANFAAATHVWDTTIITNTSMPLNVSNGGTPTWTGMTFYPNVPFPLGKSFAIRVDFSGDTANKFNLTASFRDDCADACLANPSAANSPTFTNSLYYVNATAGGTNISGINSIAFNCGPPCEEWYPQNWWIYPYVTADVAYSAAITSDSLRGCPGTVLNFVANGFGSTATPFTYEWATTSGTLSTTTDQNVSLVIDGNATITVTVTDATNATTTATVSVTSRGINVTITNPNPLNLNCGATATVTTTASGNQTGKNYTWSTGVTGPTAFSITVSAPGNYMVTVTNNSGCSSSASINVVFPGVTNNVNFNLPAPPVCQNELVTFVNTSSQLSSPWTSEWDMLNDGAILYFSQDANHAFTSPGTYTVKLTMDSAGCKFTKTRTVSVLASTNAACLVGIEDVEFSNSIALMPNPSNGNINITVNGIEKNLSIRVYNVIGSEVKTFTASDIPSSFSKSFDFGDLSNGTYLVKIQSADKSAVKRLTINK